MLASRWAAVAAATVAGLGCSPPDPEPDWVIDYVRPLAMQIEVVEPGPWSSEPQGDRTWRDALPLDTVRATPFVVTPQAPLQLDDIDAIWVQCDLDDGSCIDDLVRKGSLPPCEQLDLSAIASCMIGRGPTATFQLGVPLVPEEPIEAEFDLLYGVQIRMVAGTPGGPSTDECLQRLKESRSVFDCVLMSRSIVLGPTRRMREIMVELGAEVTIEEDARLFEDDYRNRNPLVQRFLVTDEATGDWSTASVGDTVEADPGAVLTIEYLEDEADRDTVPLGPSSEDPLGLAGAPEPLQGAWWFGAPIEWSAVGPGLTLKVVAPTEGVVPIYFVVVDGRSEAFGWLQLRVAE